MADERVEYQKQKGGVVFIWRRLRYSWVCQIHYQHIKTERTNERSKEQGYYHQVCRPSVGWLSGRSA